MRIKSTYLLVLYQRLIERRGKMPSGIAVAHSLMRSVFYSLSRMKPYRGLGANSVDEPRRYSTLERLTRRIEHHEYRVPLEPVAVPVS